MSAERGIRRHAWTSTGGFTLVEVMVALVILAVGALALTQLSVSVALLMRQSGERTVLIAAAENRLESVQARPFSQIGPGVEVDTLSLNGNRYERRLTITAPNARTRQITIDLRTPSGTGGLSYSALTYVSAP